MQLSHETVLEERAGQDADAVAPFLSVVIPCLNEEESIPQLLEKLAQLVAAISGQPRLEFIFVDDGSTDRTREILESITRSNEPYKLVIHEKNQGIAAAYLSGARVARSDLIATIDADCTYDPVLLASMTELFDAETGVVTASPYHPLGEVANLPRWRLGLSRAASWLYRRVFRQKLYTYTSCFRIYRRSVITSQQLTRNDFVGIVELLWNLELNGWGIREYPARLETRRFGQSKMRLARVILGHVSLMRRMWTQRLLPRARPRL